MTNKPKPSSLLANKFPVYRAIELAENLDSKIRVPQLKTLCEKYNVATGCLPLFAHIPLVRGDSGKVVITDTLMALKSKETLVTEQGESIDTDFLIRLFQFMGMANAGEVAGKKAMTDKNSSFIPKFLYAHKLYNGVGYEEWDKYDSRMGIALGKALAGILPVMPYFTPEFIAAYIAPNVAELRTAGLTSGDSIRPATSHMLVVHCIDVLITYVEDTEDNKKVLEFLRTKKNNQNMIAALKIILQTYMAHSSRRAPGMLLDINNWDNVPESLDAGLSELDSVRANVLPRPEGYIVKETFDDLPF